MDANRYFDLISGRRTGVLAAVQRCCLWFLSLFYRGVVGIRNCYYDFLSSPRCLDIPVVSVGNLTVGGTGKTPMTIWICKKCIQQNLRTVILSRGYRTSPEGLADEVLMMSRQCPQAVIIANPNRVAAGRLAVEEYKAQVLLLDDGFQHRRMARDLDIVLIDATRPFGYGHVLPRGLLREPINALIRANAVVMTRCDQISSSLLKEIEQTVRRYAFPGVPIIHSTHRPAGFVDLAGHPIEPPTGLRLGCLAGIARPETFVETLAGMDIQPADTTFFSDHYIYTVAEVEAIHDWIRDKELDGLITTEKDAVKLASLNAEWSVPIFVLRIEIEIQGDGEDVLAKLLDAVLREHREMDSHDD